MNMKSITALMVGILTTTVSCDMAAQYPAAVFDRVHRAFGHGRRAGPDPRLCDDGFLCKLSEHGSGGQRGSGAAGAWFLNVCRYRLRPVSGEQGSENEAH